MRNIIGSPAEGDDFFDRPKILAKLRRDLNSKANILLVAPRRVGKTSFVIRFCEQWRSDLKRNAVFLNVEGRSDEVAFTEKLLEELVGSGLDREIITHGQSVLTLIRQTRGEREVRVLGLGTSLGEVADGSHSTLGKEMESVFRGIEDGENEVLIAIDEMPEFLLALQNKDNGPSRVIAFLNWLRELRQTYRSKIRWIFLGSIGLDTFVETHKYQWLINDLQVFSLEAFTGEEADAFLKKLGESNGLTLTQAEREEIIRLVGWPLPYHLHLVFHELRDLESERSISKAFESLLLPQKLVYFDTWRERLDTQFSAADSATCKTILGHLSRFPGGVDRPQILAGLMAKPAADIGKIEEQVARLLIVLQRDGYLLEHSGRYAFRSFLLREYWHRRHGR